MGALMRAAAWVGNQTEIHTYLTRQDEKWEDGRRSAEPLPDNLGEKLMGTRDELHAAHPM